VISIAKLVLAQP